MIGTPFALPGCASPRRVTVGSGSSDKLPAFAVTCTDSATILLFRGQKDGQLHLSSLNVTAGRSGRPIERGILLADLLGHGTDGIVISNGSAGTLTFLLPK
jgi:hypothetical protein